MGIPSHSRAHFAHHELAMEVVVCTDSNSIRLIGISHMEPLLLIIVPEIVILLSTTMRQSLLLNKCQI